MYTRNSFDVPIVFCFLLTLLIFMLTYLGANGFSIKLIPRHSIDSMLFPKNLSLLEKHFRIAKLSKAQALHFESMGFVDAINSTKQGIEALQPKIEYSLGNFYIAKMNIGTPPYSALLLLDTGTDDTWVQAAKCAICFPLKYEGFDYRKSETDYAAACKHPLCVPKICKSNMCLYESVYINGFSSTKGILSIDTFTFPSNEESVSFPDLVFGMGYENQNIKFSRKMGGENVIAGILGMGSGRRSILSQQQSVTNLRFSYCLPSWNNEAATYTYLRFGDDSQVSGNTQTMVQSTPMLPYVNRYYVTALSIFMNEVLLPIDVTVFQLRADRTNGFVIDSGSGATFLVPKAYNVNKEEMIKYFLAYNWHPREISDGPSTI